MLRSNGVGEGAGLSRHLPICARKALACRRATLVFHHSAISFFEQAWSTPTALVGRALLLVAQDHLPIAAGELLDGAKLNKTRCVSAFLKVF